jgi:hypothetical protein
MGHIDEMWDHKEPHPNLDHSRLRAKIAMAVQEQANDLEDRDIQRRDKERKTFHKAQFPPAKWKVGKFKKKHLKRPRAIHEGEENPQRRNGRWDDTIVVTWVPRRTGFRHVMQTEMPAEGEIHHTECTLKDVFAEFGHVDRVKLAKSDGRAVVTFRWLADAKTAADVKLVEFNYKSFLDKKIRGFTSIALKVPSMPPPILVASDLVADDMYKDALMTRDHERFICIDTTNTVCNVTVPLKFHDNSWKELDLRHQYLNDKSIKKICHAIRWNGCRTLTSLNFSYNKMTDKGAREVLQVRYSTVQYSTVH